MATFAMIFTSLMLLTVAVLAVGLAMFVSVWSALGFLAFWGLAFLTFGRSLRRGRVGRVELNAFQRSLADD